MTLEEASSGIGTGIGIAAMGIGLGIAFDAMRGMDRSKHRHAPSYEMPKFKPIKFKGFKF